MANYLTLRLGEALIGLVLTGVSLSTFATPLVGRDINRHAVAANDASSVYLWDQDLGITWLRNANINGSADWTTQNNYAQNLVTGTGANAISDWRLPSITDGGTGCNFSYAGGTNCGYNVDTSGSEMAHLFYMTLGNLAVCSAGNVTCSFTNPGYGLHNVGDFLNMQSYAYWSGTEYAPNTSLSLVFVFSDGAQTFDSGSN
jgi:hypothetical protein